MIHEAIYCNTLVELATDYLEGGLNTETRSDVEVHIATCAGCVAYLTQLRLAVDLLGRVEEYEPLDAPDMGLLLNKFRERRTRPEGDE